MFLTCIFCKLNDQSSFSLDEMGFGNNMSLLGMTLIWPNRISLGPLCTWGHVAGCPEL